MIHMLMLLCAAHAICDFPLKDDFLTRGKNRHTTPYTWAPWYFCLLNHAVIHGGAVALITGSGWLGVAEMIVHAATDAAKCEKWIGMKMDQTIHWGCKLIWAIIAVRFLS